MIEDTITLSSTVPFIVRRPDARQYEPGGGWGGGMGGWEGWSLIREKQIYLIPAGSALLNACRASGHSKICSHSNVRQNRRGSCKRMESTALVPIHSCFYSNTAHKELKHNCILVSSIRHRYAILRPYIRPCGLDIIFMSLNTWSSSSPDYFVLIYYLVTPWVILWTWYDDLYP